MKKRVLSALLALALVAGSIPVQVFATDGDAAVTQQAAGTQITQGDAQRNTQGDLQGDVQDDPQNDPQGEAQGEPTPQGDLQPALLSTGSFTYLDASGELKTYEGEYTLLTAETTALESGWYLVRGNVTVLERITVSGHVNLILENNAWLDARSGISVKEGNSLTITAQSKSADTMGELTATGPKNYTGIGGGDGTNIGIDGASGEITINGGKITATGSGENAAGIGSVRNACGTITINGGIVEATGTLEAPGIGGTLFGGKVAINGGKITAKGGSYAPGIGGTKIEVAISGGEIISTGGTIAEGIGGNSCSVIISGGIVTATGNIGPGIGGNKTAITITGGIVTAIAGGDSAADIGKGTSYHTNPIIISGGTVYAEKIDGTSFSTGEDGNAIIHAATITGSEDTSGWNCIWFDSESEDGSVLGDVTLNENLTIAEGKTLTIEPEATLTVPEDVTFANNGTIRLELDSALVSKQPVNGVEYYVGWDTDEDGEAEASGYLASGEMPDYSGAVPVKQATAQYTYTFCGWSPKIAAATEPVLYTAQFDAKFNQYTVSLPENPVGYTLEYEGSTTLDYGSPFTFTLTLADSYLMTEDFAVCANGEKLEPVAGVYTVTVAGNTTITVEGVALAFSGVTPNGVYYTTQQVTVTDADFDTVILNGEAVSVPVTLNGDVDATYTLIATDKAGNSATITVTMKPINSLLPPDPATSSDKAQIEQLQTTVEALLGGEHLTGGERKKLEAVQDAIDTALDRLEQAGAAQDEAAESVDKVEGITPDTVKPTDKEALEAAKEDLENALENFGDNYTEEERKELEDALAQVNGALETLERVEGVQGAVDALPDTLEPDDLETVEKVEAAKEQYDQLTDHEKELAGAAGEKLEALLDAAGTYRILSGDDSSWTQGGADGLTITANGAPEKLIDLLLDGNSIDPAQYTIKKGSTIATLKPAYLATLAAGVHTLTFVYENGQVSATFTIAEAPAADSGSTGNSAGNSAAGIPATGGASSPIFWAALMVLCIVALAVVRKNAERQ